MSQKMQLSDEMLDALSGGVFTYKGQSITQISKINQHGIEAETAQGKMFFPWSHKAFQEFTPICNIDEKAVMVAALVQGREYPLEDYASKPFPVDN